MKAALIALGVILGAFLLVAIITATPLVGEVVTLHTRAPSGSWETTPLWIVDTPDGAYLRAGSPEGSGWVRRWQAEPIAKLERNGKLGAVKLTAEPKRRETINALMAARYGWADVFVGLMSDRSGAMPLRVEFVEQGD
jgi:hypothetical protein